MENNTQPTAKLAVNCIRALGIDAIDKANSGHPGIVLGAAPIAYALFNDHMSFNPKNPKFDNRDRFILSAGHGSMLNYALLHVFGYDVPMDAIETFRQDGSICTGHPEVNVCPGIETTTGPLGQGIANAVGMAIAEERLAQKFNRRGFNVVDHYTYALCGDGCMEEGIENEAASLAGTLKLGKLIVLYDSNNITIEGKTDNAFTEDVGKRHEALGWQVLYVSDANNVAAVSTAIKKAKKEKTKPSLIIVKSVIGFGSPLAGDSACHGAPLGENNVTKTKQALGYDFPPFTVPDQVQKETTANAILNGDKTEKEWNKLFEKYAKAYPELAEEYKQWFSGNVGELDDEDLWVFPKDDASRGYGSTVLNKLFKYAPNLIGGSADLGPSNKTIIKSSGDFTPTLRDGNNMHFGIREHAMGAICNGMYLHGGLRPYCATFFVFTDYMRGSMRMASIMNLPVICIMTHDSIGVGEDGPTHEPVEQMAGLRAMPNMRVFRPADGRETTAAYISALKSNSPTTIVLSRQTLPMIEGSGKDALKGGYVISKEQGETPDVIIIATGSEVLPSIKAKELLEKDGVRARVVSMPCMEIFEAQDEEYKKSVLPKSVRARVCVEAGSSSCWGKYVGLDGETVCMDVFGSSAPAKVLFAKYGFTAENIAEKAKRSIENAKK
ncbi:MAG: transketolase [Clostridia bacterium]|nr:transketolase [Clostridia bacterium]